jgi:hypothetical protein
MNIDLVLEILSSTIIVNISIIVLIIITIGGFSLVYTQLGRVLKHLRTEAEARNKHTEEFREAMRSLKTDSTIC